MARASSTGENAATNGLIAVTADIALHTADPGTTGASEMTSSVRQAITMGASSAGSSANTNAPAVAMNASTTVPDFGLWSAVTAGTYEIGGVLGSSLTTGTSAATVTFAAASVTVASS